MKLTRLFIYAILAMLSLACESTNEPSSSSNDTYNFSSVKSEKAVVYGEGGKIIPQSEWNEFIKRSYEGFQMRMSNLKLYKFKKDTNIVVLYTDYDFNVMDYYMLGDTIVANYGVYEDRYMPLGIVIDDNTIEIHFNEISYRNPNMGLATWVMWIADDPDITEIKKGEEIPHFQKVVIFKK